MDTSFINIVNFGTYFDPAIKHYNYQSSVTYDRCFKTDLDKCYGYHIRDLCVKCHDEITNPIPKRHDTRMMDKCYSWKKMINIINP
jgi:hypothetical protein